ncbi:MAG: S9 family peptidase [Gammaproteobacteria bacterium]|nr:S9 family peptidase [Gammaproteobacteria bacterium]
MKGVWLKVGLIVLGLISMVGFANTTSGLDLADYARPSQFIDIKISPQGDYLAATSRDNDGAIRLTVLDLQSRAVLSATHLRGNESVDDFHWVSNNRLLMTTAREIGALEHPIATGELIAMDADGSRRVILTGPRSRDGDFVFAELIDLLPDRNGEVLISQFSMRESQPFLDLYRMRVDSGRKRSEGRVPVRTFRGSQIHLLTDNTGTVRIARGVSPDNPNHVVMMYRPNARANWEKISEEDELEGGFIPLTFANNGEDLVGLSAHATDTYAIASFNFSDNKETLIASHPLVDLEPIFRFKYGRPQQVIGARFEFEGFEHVFFDDSRSDADVESFQRILATFPAQQVQIHSATADNSKQILTVQSANRSRQFYLFNQETNELELLAQSRPWLQDRSIPFTQAIRYQTRAGVEIHGLLTLPAGDNKKELPLVVMPHGGPIGVRDSMGIINLEAKLLADHGYAVLQPNFRGSSGFGLAFERAGFEQWGRGILADITDGVQHLVDQKLIDPERICIYGASFGGYAAVMSAIEYPEVYQCAISLSGFYDLELMFTLGDLPQSDFGLAYLQRALGTEQEQLRGQSPSHQIERLRRPLLLVHGGRDMRAPIEHLHRMEAALKRYERDYTVLVKQSEGHGFYKSENNIERWQMMLDFLAEHIGGE